MLAASAPFDNGSLALASAAMFGVSRMPVGKGLAWTCYLHILWAPIVSFSSQMSRDQSQSLKQVMDGQLSERHLRRHIVCPAAIIEEPHASQSRRQCTVSITSRDAQIF